ncbi:MAG: hypothetical protein IJP04_07845 [Clostridia bacterium]|nr:hypothetical protein [Clostridia bacterium]
MSEVAKIEQVFEYHGCEELVIAEVLRDDKEAYETGPVEPLIPLAEIGKTTELNKEVRHYDNKPKRTAIGEGPDEVTIIGAGITLGKLSKITGRSYDPTTGAAVGTPIDERYFALGYKTNDSDGFTRYVWRYKGTFSIPDESHKTKDGSADVSQTELTYTGVYTNHVFAKGKYDGTKHVPSPAKDLVVSDREGLADLTNFFDTVTTPDDLKAKTA